MRDESPCENEQVSNFVCALSDHGFLIKKIIAYSV